MKKYTKISTMKLVGDIEEKEYYYNNFLVKREITSNDGIVSMIEKYFKIGPFVIKYYNNEDDSKGFELFFYGFKKTDEIDKYIFWFKNFKNYSIQWFKSNKLTRQLIWNDDKIHDLSIKYDKNMYPTKFISTSKRYGNLIEEIKGKFIPIYPHKLHFDGIKTNDEGKEYSISGLYNTVYNKLEAYSEEFDDFLRIDSVNFNQYGDPICLKTIETPSSEKASTLFTSLVEWEYL